MEGGCVYEVREGGGVYEGKEKGSGDEKER